ncbi:glutamate synthase subunit beta [Marinobacter fonticola]|uniref:glutamate synthase subunit beta n=1 Tax=Marinobacter fonticola TaxID=2603215 RepID=UPI0011E717CD|nr:glutamate synthase subunit beta [Marinobacter fonticola]
MSENHPNGFREIARRPIGYRDPSQRIQDYREIYAPDWSVEHLREQGQRCMDCGIPTCMTGCPIGNLIPEWNDLVYRNQWREALDRLHATNNFPEFTGYTCPAPCQPACTLAYNDDPVTIKDIERAIVDKGWAEGWIQPQPPYQRTGFRVAVVGSGPAGLSVAQQLNRVGHHVEVFERDDMIGGLMTYGIPDFKFAKHQVARRVDQMQREGVIFHTGARIGPDRPLADLRSAFDAVCLAIGAQSHRDVQMPGRALDGIHFGMDYLTAANRQQAGKAVDQPIDARDRHVVVLGGGDTGADCVATAHRQGARDVVQISIRPAAPHERPEDNPWPRQPQVYEKTYAQQEGGSEQFAINTLAFEDLDGDGRVHDILAERVEWTYDERGRRKDKTVLEGDLHIPADLVLIAIGFTGPQAEAFQDEGLFLTDRGSFGTDERLMTTLPGVFACGDAHMGPSIVVWAIGEGRDAARAIDTYLTGHSNLPASLRTPNPPQWEEAGL